MAITSATVIAMSSGSRNIIDTTISRAPNTVCIVRIDFKNRSVAFFVNGVEAKQMLGHIFNIHADTIEYGAGKNDDPWIQRRERA